MKYKVWDKQNNKWVTSNVVVDAFGNLWWTFEGSMTMVDDKENYIVCRGFKFVDTWVFEGDKVMFDVAGIDDEHPPYKNQNGEVSYDESGVLSFDTWNAPYCRNVKVIGNKYTD